jgi:probable F420-dependent oxidoreductase
MRVSAFMFFTDETIGPAELAVALAERDFGGLWTAEHPHIPVRRDTPYPDPYGGGELPRMYLRLLDPFVALTAAATAAPSLRVGTGICLVALRDPVVTAKEVASLDHLTGGRFDFGVGYGWNGDEFPDHGQHFDRRHDVVREKVALMRRLWDEHVASYEGEHVSLQPSWSWPKPAVPIPVWLGGNGPRTMREAARWADVWYPTPSSAGLGDRIAAFRRMVIDEGREPSAVQVAVAAAPAEPALLEECAELGVIEISIVLPVAGRDEVLAHLDHIAGLRDHLRIPTP